MFTLSCRGKPVLVFRGYRYVVEFQVSNQGHRVLYYQGYRYNKHYTSKDNLRTTWICVKKNYGCRATVLVMQNVVIKAVKNHICSHLPCIKPHVQAILNRSS
ncbi:unnamed protein product [Colias eurytheme]|nr:unnamed protein product [Colias eurytheme]